MKFRVLAILSAFILSGCDNSAPTNEAQSSTFSTNSNQAESTVAAVSKFPAETVVGLSAIPKSAVEVPAVAAAAEHVLNEATTYDYGAAGSLKEAIDETPSVKNHEMVINGQTVKFTARAGHLTAYAPKNPSNPDKREALGSIFYMAYTRDDLPKENRPVTFFWNGGPGSSSMFLHLGSWAPKRLKVNMPTMPEGSKARKPSAFPWIDNEETLLDHSDLVFVDPIGTGYSQAIAPHANAEFWGMDSDAEMERDFITRFINYYNRQSSPKYLYGESYGGIRTPIVAKLLEQDGTGSYDQDPSGKPVEILTGIVLNSPILDYNTNPGQGSDASSAGYLPTEGMVASYYKRDTKRQGAPADQYVDTLRTFVKDKYNPARRAWYLPERSKARQLYSNADFQMEHLKTYFADAEQARAWAAITPDNALSYGQALAALLVANEAESVDFVNKFIVDPYTTLDEFTSAAKEKADVPNPNWVKYSGSPEGATFFKDMTAITGLDIDWASRFEISSNAFMNEVMPDLSLNPYDARLNIPKGAYDITFYEDDAFQSTFKKLLPDMFNYTNAGPYQGSNFDVIPDAWKYDRDPANSYSKSSIPDLVEALTYDPSLKLLALHGYYDLVTPFHQTELDLANVGLTKRVPVTNFEGGHMFYESEEARAPARKVLDEYYKATTYPADAGDVTTAVGNGVSAMVLN
jgi:carboxypeptidase C (cathepsin A)